MKWTRLRQPVFKSQSRHLFKVARIRGQEECVVHYCNRGDLQVGRCDANAASSQVLELFRRLSAKGNDVPFVKKLEEVNEASIRIDLVVYISKSPNLSNPATTLLLKRDSRSHRHLNRFIKLCKQSFTRCRLPLQDRYMISIENNHCDSVSLFSRAFRRSASRLSNAPSMTSFIKGSPSNFPTVDRQSFLRSVFPNTASSSFRTRSSIELIISLLVEIATHPFYLAGAEK